MLTPDQINLVTAIATAVSALISLVMVVVTWLMVKASRATIQIMQAQIEATARPYIRVVPVVRPMTTAIELHVSNEGASSAQMVRLTLDKDYYFNAEGATHKNIRMYAAFREPIEMLPPRAKLNFLLGVGHQILSHPELCPTRFAVTAEYSADSRTYSERTTIDLEPFKLSGMPIDPVADSVNNLAREMKEHFCSSRDAG